MRNTVKLAYGLIMKRKAFVLEQSDDHEYKSHHHRSDILLSNPILGPHLHTVKQKNKRPF